MDGTLQEILSFFTEEIKDLTRENSRLKVSLMEQQRKMDSMQKEINSLIMDKMDKKEKQDV